MAIIKEQFDPAKSKESCRKISEQYLPHRTPPAIYSKAAKMGLCNPHRYRPWTPEEEQLLETERGLPLSVVHGHLHVLSQVRGLPPLSYSDIRRQMLKRGRNAVTTKSLYLTPSEISKGLRCRASTVRLLLSKYHETLRPSSSGFKEKSATFVLKKDLLKLLLQFPAELENVHPNLFWIIRLIQGSADVPS